MAKPSRAKKRNHADAKAGFGAAPTTKSIDRSPKSMVIRIGAAEVGPSVSQLVKDMRMVMQPDTAVRLRERKNNRLRDYTTMTGPLGVTHLLLFSRSTSGNTNLRIAITPRGPTLHFRVQNYSLCKDILKSQRHPKSSQLLYLKAPLLVMNNFITNTSSTATNGASQPTQSSPSIPKHLEQLVTTVFQSLYPPLAPQQTPLPSIKRVLMLNREPTTAEDSSSYTITLRHYAISTKSTGLPKAIKRLQRAENVGSGNGDVKHGHAVPRKGKSMPNLGRLDDVSDWMLDPAAGGYTSASDSEPETDAEVEVLAAQTRTLNNRKKQRSSEGAATRHGVEKRAVKLTELGPRMKLRLVKVEEGLCEGRVMWHEFIHLSKEEQVKQDKDWEAKRREKEDRKKVQRENLERKKVETQAKKGGNARAHGQAENGDEDDDEDVEEDGFWDSDALEYQGMDEDEEEDEDQYEDVEDESDADETVEAMEDVRDD